MEHVVKSSFDTSEIKSRIRSSYNQIAHTYLKWSAPYRDLSHSLVKQYIIPYLGSISSPTALELGCGAGIPTTKSLSEVINIKVTANDISTTQIGLAKQNLPQEKLDFVEGDMMALRFPEASFDTVLAMYSIMHLPREEQAVMIVRIASWLKPGGLFLCSFPGESSETIVEGDWLEKGAWMYWSSWGKDGSLCKVKESGLQVVMEKIIGDEGGGDENTSKPMFLWVVARKGADDSNKEQADL